MKLSQSQIKAQKAIWSSVEPIRGRLQIQEFMSLVLFLLIWAKYIPQSKKDVIGYFDILEELDDDKKLNDDQLKKRYEEISKRRVKLSILLQFIAKQKKISVDEKELTNGMMAYTSQYPGQEKEIMEYFKKNPSAIETIRGPILEEKVIENVISSANIIKKIIDKKEYENLEKITFEIKSIKRVFPDPTLPCK